MRAVIFDAPGGADALRVTATPTPAPVLSEVLVR
jgi:NADPH:quinone reductase-like Zn-dependent oxidoreductase